MKQIVLSTTDDYDGSLDGCHVLYGKMCGVHKHGILLIVRPEERERVRQLVATVGALPVPALAELLTCLSNSAAGGISRMFSVHILVAQATLPPPPPHQPPGNPRLN